MPHINGEIQPSQVKAVATYDIGLYGEDLFLPFIKWIDTINNIKKYNKFKNYILSHLSENFYDSGFKKEGNEIEIILNSNTNWKTNLNKIKKVLKTSL